MNEVDLGTLDQFLADLWRPIALNPSDVFVFGRYVPHATFAEPEMQTERTSCDIRCSCGPAAFYNDLVNTH